MWFVEHKLYCQHAALHICSQIETVIRNGFIGVQSSIFPFFTGSETKTTGTAATTVIENSQCYRKWEYNTSIHEQ